MRIAPMLPPWPGLIQDEPGRCHELFNSRLVWNLPGNLLFPTNPTNLIEGVHCRHGRSGWIDATEEFSQQKGMSVLAAEALPTQTNDGPAQGFTEKVTKMVKNRLVIGPALSKRAHERRPIRAAACTPTSLLIVRARWRYIAQQDSREPADVDANFKRRRRG